MATVMDVKPAQGRCAAVVASAASPHNTAPRHWATLLAGLVHSKAAPFADWHTNAMEKEKGQLTLFDCRKVRIGSHALVPSATDTLTATYQWLLAKAEPQQQGAARSDALCASFLPSGGVWQELGVL